MRRRLLLSYLTITVVVLIGLQVPLGFSFARSERRRLEQSVRQDAVTLAIRSEENLEGGPDAAGRAELAALIARYQRESGDRVLITDAAGHALASSEPSGDGDGRQRQLFAPPEIARALAGHETSGSRYSDALGTDVWFTALPVGVNGRVLGMVRVTHSMSSVEARVRNNWLLLAALGGGVLAVVFAVSLLVARSVTRPLADLGRAAARLGRGELGSRAPVPTGPAELRLLAAEFNTTAAKLEELVGAQQAFVVDASHQLRTPLAALRLRLENLESEVGAAGVDDIEGARAETERLTRLVDGLLTLARAEQGGSGPVDIDVSEVIEGRREAWTAFAAERGVRVDADVEPDLRVRATPEHLEQVLDNLLNNALDVAPSGSAVTLAAARRRDRVELRVRDAGPGMSAEQRARAFDRFWRAADAPGEAGGFGLGLAIVRRLVTADGGTVELRAAAGGGLEAVVHLRAGPRAASSSGAARAASSPAGLGTPPRP